MSKTIIFIGDSIVEGTDYGGVTTAQTFASLIGIANGYAASSIVNAGVSGDTSAGMLARIGNGVLAHSPAVCVFMIGLNDWSTGVSVATYQANIKQFIEQLLVNNVKPVGFTSSLERGATSVFSGFKPYLEAFDTECGCHAVQKVDLYREMALSYLYLSSVDFNNLYADGIVHLSVIGHAFVASLAARPVFNSGLFL